MNQNSKPCTNCEHKQGISTCSNTGKCPNKPVSQNNDPKRFLDMIGGKSAEFLKTQFK